MLSAHSASLLAGASLCSIIIAVKAARRKPLWCAIANVILRHHDKVCMAVNAFIVILFSSILQPYRRRRAFSSPAEISSCGDEEARMKWAGIYLLAHQQRLRLKKWWRAACPFVLSFAAKYAQKAEESSLMLAYGAIGHQALGAPGGRKPIRAALGAGQRVKSHHARASACRKPKRQARYRWRRQHLEPARVAADGEAAQIIAMA